VEVVRLKEFLQQTAPDVDPRLLDRPLEDAEQAIRDRGQWETKLPRKRKYLSVLEGDKARQMLKDFLKDAAFGRENLRRAMKAKPQGMPSPFCFLSLPASTLAVRDRNKIKAHKELTTSKNATGIQTSSKNATFRKRR
jgi:hypothetical protein